MTAWQKASAEEMYEAAMRYCDIHSISVTTDEDAAEPFFFGVTPKDAPTLLALSALVSLAAGSSFDSAAPPKIYRWRAVAKDGHLIARGTVRA